MPEPLKVELYIEDEKDKLHLWEQLSKAQKAQFAEQLSETYLKAFSYCVQDKTDKAGVCLD